MYVAMWSLPGCIPEMEPARFDTFKEAQSFLCDECQIAADQTHETDESVSAEWETMVEMIAGVSDAPVIETAPDGYVYTITRE